MAIHNLATGTGKCANARRALMAIVLVIQNPAGWSAGKTVFHDGLAQPLGITGVEQGRVLLRETETGVPAHVAGKGDGQNRAVPENVEPLAQR